MKRNLWTAVFGMALVAGCGEMDFGAPASVADEGVGRSLEEKAGDIAVVVLDHASLDPIADAEVTLVSADKPAGAARTDRDGRGLLAVDGPAPWPHLALSGERLVGARVFTGATRPAELDDRTFTMMTPSEWHKLHATHDAEPAPGTGLVLVRVTFADGAPAPVRTLRLYSDASPIALERCGWYFPDGSLVAVSTCPDPGAKASDRRSAPDSRISAWLQSSDEFALFNIPAGPNAVTAEALDAGAPPAPSSELMSTVIFDVRAGEVTFVEVTLPPAP